MTFEPLLAYGVAISVIFVLGLMAHHNGRSGWRRERNDLPMEILLRWVAERTAPHTYEAAGRTTGSPTHTSTGETSRVRVGLLALQTVVGTGKTAAPAATGIAVEDKAVKS